VSQPQFTPEEVADLRKLIANYREAMKAAETVDRLTGQPDCEDPEKAKLKERVAELEAYALRLEGQLGAAPAPVGSGMTSEMTGVETGKRPTSRRKGARRGAGKR
jgi:hypothetical protein